jgi:hypothetical protein
MKSTTHKSKTHKSKTHKSKTKKKQYTSLNTMDMQAFCKSKINDDTSKIIKFLHSKPTKLQIDKLYETTLYFLGIFIKEVFGRWQLDCEDLIFNRKIFNFRLLFIMNMSIIFTPLHI